MSSPSRGRPAMAREPVERSGALRVPHQRAQVHRRNPSGERALAARRRRGGRRRAGSVAVAMQRYETHPENGLSMMRGRFMVSGGMPSERPTRASCNGAGPVFRLRAAPRINAKPVSEPRTPFCNDAGRNWNKKGNFLLDCFEKKSYFCNRFR